MRENFGKNERLVVGACGWEEGVKVLSSSPVVH